MDICFDLFCKEEKVGRIEIKDGVLVRNDVYTSDFYKQPYGRVTEAKEMIAILHDRVMPIHRWTDEILQGWGLKEYDFWEILRKTHGTNYNDYFWIRFDGDESTYEDVKIRE